MNVKEHLRIVVMEGRKRKAERRVGDHLEIKSGRWLHISRLIDWANDWYSKKITDPATGETVYEQEHPLSEHRGRGSAKPRKNTNESGTGAEHST